MSPWVIGPPATSLAIFRLRFLTDLTFSLCCLLDLFLLRRSGDLKAIRQTRQEHAIFISLQEILYLIGLLNSRRKCDPALGLDYSSFGLAKPSSSRSPFPVTVSSGRAITSFACSACLLLLRCCLTFLFCLITMSHILQVYVPSL